MRAPGNTVGFGRTNGGRARAAAGAAGGCGGTDAAGRRGAAGAGGGGAAGATAGAAGAPTFARTATTSRWSPSTTNVTERSSTAPGEPGGVMVTVACAMPPAGMGSGGHATFVQLQLAAAIVMERGSRPRLRMVIVPERDSPCGTSPRSSTIGSKASPDAPGDCSCPRTSTAAATPTERRAAITSAIRNFLEPMDSA